MSFVSTSDVKHLALPAALMVVMALPLTGCGPTVFEGKTGISVVGSLPPPPPPPPPKKEPPKRVVLTKEKIQINEKIQFDLNKAVIKQVSFDLLSEVADVINKNPQVKKIRIEGHASSDGPDDHNLRLSDRRAKAVMKHLIEKGKVDKGKLTAEGFGEKRPIADNETEEGRVANRRVEFMITEQDEKKDEAK